MPYVIMSGITMGRYFLVLILMLFAATSGFSGSLVFSQYSEQHGFPASSVQKIAQDSAGFLWIATYGSGLYRFDSKSFVNYTVADGLSNNIIYDVLPVGDKVYVATRSGLSIYDGQKFSVIKIDSIPSLNMVYALQKDEEGAVWMSGTFDGLRKLMGDSIISYPVGQAVGSVFKMTRDHSGNIYMATSKDKILLLSGDSLRVFREFGDQVSCLQYGADSALWVITQHTLYRFRNGVWTSVEEGNYLQALLTTAKDGAVYLSYDSQVYSYSCRHDGTIVKKRVSDSNFPQTNVLDIYVDTEDNFWVGTYGDGLFKGSIKTFNPHLYPQLIESVVMGIEQDRFGNLYYATLTDGLFLQRGEELTNITDSLRVPTKHLSSIQIDRHGRIWLGTRGSGLVKVENGVANILQIGEKNGLSGNVLGEDTSGGVWLSDAYGLYVHKDGSYNVYRVADGLYSDRVLDFFETSKGEILISTTGGISVFDGLRFRPYFPDLFQDKEVTHIAEDVYGNLWFAVLGEGILYLQKTTEKEFVTKTFGSREGIFPGLVFSLFAHNSSIWVGAAKGLNEIVIDGNKIIQVKSYNEEDGFFGKEVNSDAYLGRGDSLLFGTLRGVYRYVPVNTETGRPPYLHEVYVNGKLIKQDADVSPGHLVFCTGNGPVTLSFNVINFADRKHMYFSWRLSEAEDRWSVPTTDSQIAFQDLKPGAYSLQVKAGTLETVHAATPLELKFLVTAPFYLDWRFHLLVGVGVLILIYFVIGFFSKYKVKKALKLENFRNHEREVIRKNLAQDFHDEIGNLIVSINTYSNVLKLKLKNAPEDINSTLDKIQAVSKALFSNTKDFIWSMDRDSDELVEVFLHIKDFGEQFFRYTHVTFISQSFLDYQDQIPLPQGSGRHLTRIYKEVMTNVLKHSNATEVSFSLEYTSVDDEFILNFNDNGNNMVNLDSKGYGLKNIRNRAEVIGARAVLLSTSGGFSVKLFLKNKINRRSLQKLSSGV